MKMTKMNYFMVKIGDNTTAIKELREHVKLLADLTRSGFKCMDELSIALKALNLAMGLENDNDEENVLTKFINNFSGDKLVISSGKLVIVDETHRGIGKTSILAEYAKKYNLGIITGSAMQREHIINKFNVNAYSEGQLQSSDKGILIDCSVSLAEIARLQGKGIRICGGFHHNRIFDY